MRRLPALGIPHRESTGRSSPQKTNALVKSDVSVDDVPAIDRQIADGRIGNLVAAHELSAAWSAVVMLHFDEHMPLAQAAAVLRRRIGERRR
jgi:hypothetical protein